MSEALSALQPAENDIIKTQDAFAICHNGQWIGTLERMKPGEGYMYFSGQPARLTYPVTRVFPVSSEPSASRKSAAAPWTYNAHQYADNTTLIGQLYANGTQALEGTYTVGAFYGNECRGIGKYADGKLFFAIHGMIANNENISFKAYENATGQEYNISESIIFNGQQEGSLSAPYRLNVKNDATGIGDITTGKYTVYPRPLHSRLYINGENADIKTVQVLSSDGAVNIQQTGYTDGGIDVSGLLPGVYLVAITLNNGKVYYEKVIKAQN